MVPNVAVTYFVFMEGDQVAGFCGDGNEFSGCIKKGICNAAGELLAFQRVLYPINLFIHLFILSPRFQSSGM